MTQSRLRFRSRDERRQPARRQADDGETLERVDAGLRTDDLEQARHDVDLHVELSQLADRPELLLVVRVGERDDHALDVEHRDDLGQPIGRPDEGEVLELGPARPRVRVDEADEVDAVLRVLEELPRRELADVAGADDDRVLEVERTAPRDRAREARGPTSRSTIASSQKRMSLGTCGLARPASHEATKNAHAPSVTSWKTPTTSSIVEWSTCSSSRS